jgi:hypothetical protein
VHFLADPLHYAGPNADLTADFKEADACLQSAPDALFELGVDLRPAERLASRT